MFVLSLSNSARRAEIEALTLSMTFPDVIQFTLNMSGIYIFEKANLYNPDYIQFNLHREIQSAFDANEVWDKDFVWPA